MWSLGLSERLVAMRADAVRVLIREKLVDGRLAFDITSRWWGGPGANEVCAACEEKIPPTAVVMEGGSDGAHVVQFHIACFQLWDEECRALRRNSA